MKIFEAIRNDHDSQRDLLDKLSKTSGESDEREILFKELTAQLQEHAKAEERYFYSPLMEDENAILHSRHGIAEHHDIDKYIETLENTEFDSPQWLKTLKRLQHKVLHHLEEEEHVFFQQAGKVLTEKQKVELAEEYMHEMEAAELER